MLQKIKKYWLVFLMKQFDLFQKKKALHEKTMLISQFKKVGEAFKISKDYYRLCKCEMLFFFFREF